MQRHLCTKKKTRRHFCSAHSIGGMWRLSKICVPLSSSTKKTDVVMCHLRQWQRHWCNSNKDFGYALSKASDHAKGKKAAQKTHPSRQFLTTDPKFVTFFVTFLNGPLKPQRWKSSVHHSQKKILLNQHVLIL